MVWFKRDLRVHDHAPLTEAAAAGPVIALYVVEPAYWHLPDTSERQWRFVRAALADLDQALHRRGLALTVCVGDVVEVLRSLRETTAFEALWSHQETGNGWTYARDRAVRAFCRAHGIPWHERLQAGIWRGMTDRDAWHAFHESVLQAPCVRAPARLEGVTLHGDVTAGDDPLGLATEPLETMQRAGRREAIALVESFLAGRGRDYLRGMSSPTTSEHVCSRLSAHLAVGSVSAREVLHRLSAARRTLAATAPHERPVPLAAIDALVARIHWRDHFTQKLEREPAIEFRSQHALFEARRTPTDPSHPWLLAWQKGQTGWPFVDACMRALRATGWITFRARAMLQSIASHHLGLDWRASGEVLARAFVDYDPGIHWPQVQMQSGHTGINVPRMYNPIKQSRDQDPSGAFVRRWVPELASCAGDTVHAPWETGGVQGYPAPLCDATEAMRAARARMKAVYERPDFARIAQEVYERHGSRARPMRSDYQAGRAPRGPRRPSSQLTLPGLEAPPPRPGT